MDPCLFVIDRDTSIEDPDSLPHAENPELTHVRERGHLAPMESGLPDCIPSHIIRSWVLIHTDDCDAYGEDMSILHDINNIMNDKWTTEIVDSSFVLGVKRELSIDDEGLWSFKMSMSAFISDLYDVYDDDIIRTPPKKELGNMITILVN